jgi:hypothetical protein
VAALLPLLLTVGSRRDHRLGPAGPDRPDQRVAVVALIRDHVLGLDARDQRGALDDVGDLPAGGDQPDRVAPRIDGDVDLGPEAAPRPAQRLILAYPFFAAPAAC